MTKKEAAIVEIYSGCCMLTGTDRKYVYEYASSLLGRAVFTHELASRAKELHEKSKADFIKLCKNLKDSEISQPSKCDLHGKWIICSDGYYPYCSECGCEPRSREMTKFCAECGAKMDK